MVENVVKTKVEVITKRCIMLKTGDEYRAATLERNRRYRAKLALMGTKPANQVRMVQFIITIRLPVVSIRKIS